MLWGEEVDTVVERVSLGLVVAFGACKMVDSLGAGAVCGNFPHFHPFYDKLG